MRCALYWSLVISVCLGLYPAGGRVCHSAETFEAEGVSSREARNQAARSVPLHRLSPQARAQVDQVLDNPSFFRRMPTQQIDCDPAMLKFLVRRPEVMVNIWDLMGITKVSANRTAPYSFLANDGVGTTCKCDLIYSDANLHIYHGQGRYAGSMAPRQVTGNCVCVLHTQDRSNAEGAPQIAGTMDVFLKLDNFGADILTRTLGPFVGKTADYNFVETAKFISQIQQICVHSPAAAQGLAMKLDKVDESARREFAGIAARIAVNSMSEFPEAYEPSQPSYTREADSIAQGPLPRSARPEEDRSQLPKPIALSLSGLERADRVPVPALTFERSAPPSAITPVKPNIYMRR